MCSDAPNAIPQEVDALMFLRPLIATVLGALLGYEQERAGSPLASAPTDGCLGAVLFAVVSLHCFGGVGDRADGFRTGRHRDWLSGAGAIINQQGSVHSLTKLRRCGLPRPSG